MRTIKIKNRAFMLYDKHNAYLLLRIYIYIMWILLHFLIAADVNYQFIKTRRTIKEICFKNQKNGKKLTYRKIKQYIAEPQ